MSDPLAAMRCWSIELTVGDRVFEIPALTAADWWPALTSGQPIAGVLDLVESGELDELILAGEIDGEALHESLTEALEEVAGRSVHKAIVLAAVAEAHWVVIGGQLARRGFRWDQMPLAAALDAVHLTIVEGLDEKAKAQFDALLDNESLSQGKQSERTREKALDDFSAMAGPRPTGGLKSTGAPSDSARSKTRRQRQPPRPAAPSDEPMPQPGPPAGSGPAATSAGRAAAAGPASGIELRPPL